MRFATQAAPHAKAITSVPLVMRRVLYALLPAATAYTWFFGWGLLLNFAVAAAAALAAEAAVLRLRGREVAPVLADGSALVTAALLAFALPPLVPFWLPLLGSVVAIVLAKHLFGGLGKNLFNPAMVGYVLLLVSFPVAMTQWLPPRLGDLDYHHLSFVEQIGYMTVGRTPAGMDVDALTRATPLDQLKDGLRAGRSFADVRASSLFGDLGGQGWEWVGNALILGGLYLLYRGVIRWQIPVAMLTGVLVPALLGHLVAPERFGTPAFHLFSGATLLGAFFIATDPVSAAATTRGRLVYGAGIGLLTFAIRAFGTYPDGLAFAVLFMNAAVPLIDRYTRPRIYGQA
jgi:Na+-translocating ferredoxin:NAD+ oxidoreductase subunit D